MFSSDRYFLQCNATLAKGVTSKKEAKMVAKHWKADPVHMSPDGYEKLALCIIEDLLDMDFERPVEQEDDKQQLSGTGLSQGSARGRGTGTERGSVDRAASRRDWVSRNDAVVHRNYGTEDKQYPRGGRGHQGHSGGRGGGWKSHRGHRGSFSRSRGKSYKFRPY
jgi:hypothetical protein